MTSSYTDSQEAMLAAERVALQRDHVRRPTANKALWSGIAISGGGIRSATYALGAVQALAHHGLLPKFDYISSVSGGSYLASSLQWWWAGAKDAGASFGTRRENFPYGLGTLTAAGPTADTPGQRQNLAYLSHHAHYLDPGNGLSIVAGIGVVLRTVLVSLLVWVPLSVLFFILTFLIDQGVVVPLAEMTGGWLPGRLLDAFAHWNDPRGGCWLAAVAMDCGLNLRLTYALAIAALPVWALLFASLAILLGLASRTSDRAVRPVRPLPIVLKCLAIAVLAYPEFVLAGAEKSLGAVSALALLFMATIWFVSDLLAPAIGDQSYTFRRWFQRAFASSAGPVFAITLLGLIPVIDKVMFAYFSELAKADGLADASTHRNTFANISTVVSLVSGVSTSLYGYYSLTRKASPSLAASIFSSLGAFIFIYGLLLATHMQAVLVYEASFGTQSTLIDNLAKIFNNDESINSLIRTLAILSISFSIFLAATINVNHLGLHRFYRDRLMESFMPSAKAVDTNSNRKTKAADRFSVTDQPCPSGAADARDPLPYSIVNTIAILTNETDQTIAMRGGENFVISPLFVGCGATGWADTRRYVQLNGPLTLATAMAASGAAVNADSGYVGAGVTRGRLLSTAMSLLNMRLGVWIANPRPSRWFFNRVPTYFRPMLRQGLLGLGHKRDSAFLELADGGHFDNLGLYELVRRRLDLIVVVDGEADSALAMPGFVSVLRRIEEDFQAKVEFTPGHGVERFIGSDVRDFFPRTAKPAQSSFLVARIRYRDTDRSGTLIYVKLAGLKDLDFTTLGYWAANDVFPYESTVNQFFTVAQFEAYRNLGYSAVKEMVTGLDLEANFEDPAAIRKAYTFRTQPGSFNS